MLMYWNKISWFMKPFVLDTVQNAKNVTKSSKMKKEKLIWKPITLNHNAPFVFSCLIKFNLKSIEINALKHQKSVLCAA